MSEDRKQSAGLHSPRERLLEARHELIVGIALTIAALGVDALLGHNAIGNYLKLQANHWFQSSQQVETALPVCVVDITSLKQKSYAIMNSSGKVSDEQFTSRRNLQNLIIKIATGSPAAIGVDVDLSIEPEISPGQELKSESSQLCDMAIGLSVQSNPPTRIVLGIKRNEGLSPEKWLGDKRYIPLAASLGRPLGTVGRMPMEFIFPGHSEKLRSLASALVAESTKEKEPKWLPMIAERIHEESPLLEAPEFKFTEFPVNYSQLDALTRATISSEKVMELTPVELSNRFKGAFVLLGDAKYEADKASVPGRQEPVPGVFVHASAAYTLACAPLWELKEWFSLTTTAFISAFVLLIIYQINTKFGQHFPIPPVALGVLHTFLWIIVFCLVAWWLATNEQILWLEVIAVCLVLILHCFLDVLVGTIKWKRLREELVDPFSQAPQPGQ